MGWSRETRIMATLFPKIQMVCGCLTSLGRTLTSANPMSKNSLALFNPSGFLIINPWYLIFSFTLRLCQLGRYLLTAKERD